MNLSIIAAAKFEVEALKNVLEQLGFTPEVHVLGIGALNAAKNARPIAEACRGKNVVFVGTCGSFNHFSKPYLVTGKEVHWLPSISTIGTLPEQYAADQCVENLELYSCAAEISAKAAEFSVVLCVTNTVGPDSHSQWKQHFLSAATETAEYFKNALSMRKK